MQKLVGICPACEKQSKFDILTIVTETKDNTLHFCQCHECRNNVYVATLRIPRSDYKPILAKGTSIEDGDSPPHKGQNELEF